MPASIPSSQEESQPAGQVWPADRKADLVLEGLRRHRPVTQLCREAGVSPTRYYQWRQDFIEAGRAGLTYPEPERRALEERVRQLEAENANLRRRMQIFQDLCTAD